MIFCLMKIVWKCECIVREALNLPDWSCLRQRYNTPDKFRLSCLYTNIRRQESFYFYLHPTRFPYWSQTLPSTVRCRTSACRIFSQLLSLGYFSSFSQPVIESAIIAASVSVIIYFIVFLQKNNFIYTLCSPSIMRFAKARSLIQGAGRHFHAPVLSCQSLSRRIDSHNPSIVELRCGERLAGA